MDNLSVQALRERAAEAVTAHKNAYYREGGYIGADFWDFAEIFEIIEDLYEVTGDRGLFTQFSAMYDRTLRDYTEDWKDNPYNDDIMWLVIALTRAYLYTKETRYLETAKYNFDRTYERAWSDALGGGLFWRIENRSKNTCVNCPGSIAAALLARATGDESYWDKSRKCVDWTSRVMFEPETGKVYDNIKLDGTVRTWSSTYNQGTFIGACLLNYEHDGDEKWVEYAKSAVGYTIHTMYADDVMDNEGEGNDLPGFKGILARYLRYYSEKLGDNGCLKWLRMNADRAWANRNRQGLMSTLLGHRTEDGSSFDVFTMSAAVSVVVNAADSVRGYGQYH